MKAKVLFCYYTEGSDFTIVRVYLEKDFEQANNDLEMMIKYASDCRNWDIQEIEVFNSK